jgi:endonuclease/exonuclease/phosphatase family metal-dependent hydrolase
MSSTPKTFACMSYNIRYDNPRDGEHRWDNRKASIVELIQQYRPALWGIQEGMHRQVAYLENELPNYAYIGVGRQDGKTEGEYCAIFYDTTQFKLLQSATFWLSEQSQEPSVGWDAAHKRICTYGLFECLATQCQVYCLNTHFDHRGKQAQVRAAQLIIDKIAELNPAQLPVILMGDLNVTAKSKAVKLLKTTFTDAKSISEQKPQGSKATYMGFGANIFLRKRIDYIFTQSLKVLSYAHLNPQTPEGRPASDHVPVFTQLMFINLI